MKKLAAILLLALCCAGASADTFMAGQVLTAASLNAALAAPVISGGSINGAPIGATTPSTGAFTAMKAGDPASGKVLSAGQNTTTATDFATAHVNRTTTHSGGTPGAVNAAFRADHNVGVGVADFEWAIVGVMNNSATGGQNVGVYGQGNKITGTTGPTWGGVMEAQEKTAIDNPSWGLVGLEVDNRSNGTDSNQSRIGIDIVAARYNTSGPATTMSHGVRVQNNGDASTLVDKAFSVIANNVNVGLDTTAATINTAAVRMAAGQSIAFDAASTLTLKESTGAFVLSGGPMALTSATSYATIGGGVAAHYGNMSGVTLSANTVIGWNRSAGGGETNFVNYKGAGSSGGFDWRYGTGTSDVIVMSLSTSGVVKPVGGYALTNMLVSTTAPTISSGFGTSPSVTASNGTATFRINVGTGGTASSGVIRLPAAAGGWNCFAQDITTTANAWQTKQTASTTTSVTLTNYNAGAATAWAAGDVLMVNCLAH